MKLALPAAAFVAPLLVQITTATAQDTAGFLSPSKNIACQYFAEGKSGTIRCDIANMASRAKRPADCDLEWGDAFEISTNGRSGARICHGDTMMDPSLPVLAYGSAFDRGGFTCKSEPSGVTCRNAGQHGFTLSRTAQTVF